MPLRIVAFHGFGTKPKTSNFCQTVAKYYGSKNIEVITPKYNYLTGDPTKDFNKLDKQILSMINSDDKSLYFYGISLGGFIARHFALKYERPMALFNPTIKPWLDVEKYIKRMPLLNNIIVTRALIKRVVNAAKKCEMYFMDHHIQRQALILTKDDNVLEWEDSYAYFENKAYIHLNDYGGHAFDSSAVLQQSLKQLDENWLYVEKNKKEKR